MMRFLTAFLMLVSVGFGQTVVDLNVPQLTTKIVTKEMGIVRPLYGASTIQGTLIVQAGAIIELPANGNLRIDFRGTLDCRGTQADPVTIREQSGARWNQIDTNYRSGSYRPTILMTYTNLSGAGNGVGASTIFANHALVMLDNVSITMPKTNLAAKQTTGMSFGPNIYNSILNITYNCTGIVSNTKVNGSTFGISDRGKTVDFIDVECFNVDTPFVWQPVATQPQLYHRFSVER